MRQVRFLPVLVLTILMSACNDELLINEGGSKGQGTVLLNLISDDGSYSTKTDGSGDVGQTPTRQDTLNQFWVEIYRKGTDGLTDGLRLYRKQYAEARQERILLNAGDYYLRAKFGDSLGVGFTKPFLMAEKEFSVQPQQEINVEATAYLSNVKVSVRFGEKFKEYYPDYYVLIEHNDPKVRKSLKFVKDETRSGYIHHGGLTAYICADFKGDGNWKYYKLSEADLNNDDVPDPLSFSPKDHFILDVDAGEKLYGDLSVNIFINDEVVPVGKDITIPEYKAPQDGPMANRQGFDLSVDGSDGYTYVYEGRTVEYNDGQSFSYSADAGLKSCVLNIGSRYLKDAYGLDGDYTLASLASDGMTLVPDENIINRLETAGIVCRIGQFMGIIDFTEAMKALGKNSVYVSDTEPCAAFSLNVTDEAGATASTEGSMIVWPLMEGTLNIPEVSWWGWKVASPVVNLTKGKAAYCQLQFSEDGVNWDLIQTSGSVASDGKTITFADKSGLSSDRDYWFRAVDAVSGYQVGDIVKVHTEYPYQLGNPSFEEFRVQEFTLHNKLLFNRECGTRLWYDLFNDKSSGTRWATNSSATLDAYISTNAYSYYKSYPTITVQKGNAAAGDYYVMIASISVEDGASEIDSGKAKTGEIWIGEADNSGEKKGNHTDNGDPFYSRPSKLTFQHKFSQHENDPYLVEVQVWDSGKNVIGKGSLSSATSVEPSWRLAEVPITYSVTDRKAAYIYVSFKSSATGSEARRKFKGATGLPNTHVDKNLNSANNDTIYAGSILWVDDVRLVYSE